MKKTRHKKYSIIKSLAKKELEKIEEAKEEINKRLTIPPNPQRKINEFFPKDEHYWTKYNRARTSEKRMFYMLLDDLLEVIPTPKTENGRPPVPLKDLIFCACIKLYHVFSGQRISSGIKDVKPNCV